MTVKRLITIFLLSFMSAIIILFRNDILIITKDPNYLNEFIKSYGKFAIAVFLLLSSIRSLFLLPAGIFAITSGITFGTMLGTILTCIGVTLSAIIAFLISRFAGRQIAVKLFGKKIINFEKRFREKGIIYVMIFRMIPVFPFDLVSCAFGLSNIRITSFIFGTLFGSIPGAFVYTYLGNNIKYTHSRQFSLSLFLVIIITIIPLLFKYVSREG